MGERGETIAENFHFQPPFGYWRKVEDERLGIGARYKMMS